MASAQHSTSYQVSDFLKDRHPYSVKDGFKARREEEKTKVHAGFGLPGLKDNINHLVRKDISAAGKEQALKNILRQLSSQEMKVRLCEMGLASALKQVICESPRCDRLVCQAFRQLSVLPTCMATLYLDGCVPAVVDVLVQEEVPAGADREEVAAAKLAACEALRQMAHAWDGRRWLLGEKVPEAMASGPATPKVPTIDEDPVQFELWERKREELARRVVACLVKVIGDPEVSSPLLLSGLRCLASLTTEDKGLQYALYEAALRDLHTVLERYERQGDAWIQVDEDTEIVRSAVTVVWNIAMDDFGKDGAVDVPLVPTTLGRLLQHTVRYPDRLSRVKAAITGAMAAIYIKAETKKTGIEPLHDPPQMEDGEQVDIRLLLVQLLKQANATYAPIRAAQKAGEDPLLDDNQAHILDVIKNTNQVIRLLAELPEARRRLKMLLKEEPMELRRQIFYSTRFEEEMLGFKVDGNAS